MKKNILTIEEVTVNLKEIFKDSQNVQHISCEEMQEGKYSSDLIYRIVTKEAECLIGRKTGYFRFIDSTKNDQRDIIFNFKGQWFVKLIDKELIHKLRDACNFSVKKTIAEISMWQQVLQSPWNVNIKSDTDAKFIAAEFKNFIDYTKSLCENFSTVIITYDETILTWKYYTGSGKTFKEGKAKRMIDGLDIDILIPELEKIVNQHNKRIVNKMAMLIAA